MVCSASLCWLSVVRADPCRAFCYALKVTLSETVRWKPTPKPGQEQPISIPTVRVIAEGVLDPNVAGAARLDKAARKAAAASRTAVPLLACCLPSLPLPAGTNGCCWRGGCCSTPTNTHLAPSQAAAAEGERGRERDRDQMTKSMLEALAKNSGCTQLRVRRDARAPYSGKLIEVEHELTFYLDTNDKTSPAGDFNPKLSMKIKVNNTADSAGEAATPGVPCAEFGWQHLRHLLSELEKKAAKFNLPNGWSPTVAQAVDLAVPPGLFGSAAPMAGEAPIAVVAVPVGEAVLQSAGETGAYTGVEPLVPVVEAVSVLGSK